jgi:hypothetical protein
MAAETAKSLRSNAPYDPTTANDFGVRKFTGGVAATETTHSGNAIPAAWCGGEVGLICVGGVCHVAFSTRRDSSGAVTGEVDRAVAATAAGASDKVGVPLPDSLSIETRMRVPDKEPGETMFFLRESNTTGVIVYMRKLG